MSDLERRFLSYLTDTKELAKSWDLGINEKVFEDPVCREVFKFAVAYWQEHGTAPTQFAVTEEYPAFRFETEIEEAAAWYVERLQRRFVTNQLQELVVTAGTEALDDPLGALRRLHAAAYEAAEAVAPRLTRSDMLNVDDRRRRYDLRASTPGGIGLPFGIGELDTHTGGTMPGELVALGAYSKTGKTFFLAHVAVALAKAGYRPIVFTLEMGLGEIEDRVDAMYSGVSYNRLTHATLKDVEKARWEEAQEELASEGGLLIESPPEGERTVAALLNRARQAGANYVIIDQLSHMEPGKKVNSLKEHHGTIMKQLSVELSRPGKELPCLLAVQLNRDSQNPDDPLSMKHFANAAEIEREVDLALGLSQNGEERRNRIMKISILGGRRCNVRHWQLYWDLVESTSIRVFSEVVD